MKMKVHQNFQNEPKAILRGIATNVNLKKQEVSNKKPNFTPQGAGEKERKLKVNRKKEIKKIGEELLKKTPNERSPMKQS